MISRRSFITGLALAAVAMSTPALALAGNNSNLDGDPLPDFQDMSNEQAEHRQPEQRPMYIKGVLNLKSGHTGERYCFPYRDAQGVYDPQVMMALNWFMRCHYDEKFLLMDARVIEMLNYVTKWFPGNPEVTINSAYRTPAYNALIARHNENVAKNSLHMRGQAIDFSVKGVPIRQVCQVAQTVRNTFGHGGCGYYPRENFVHLDCGDRAATWIR